MIRNYRFKLPLLPHRVDILIGREMAKRYCDWHEIRNIESIGAFIDGRCAGCVQQVGGNVSCIVMLPDHYYQLLSAGRLNQTYISHP